MKWATRRTAPPDAATPILTSADLSGHVHHARSRHLHLNGLNDTAQPPLAVRKPWGLWWAEGADWTRYYETHRTALRQRGLSRSGPGRWVFGVTPDPEAKLIHLASLEGVLAFSERYAVLSGGPWVYQPPDPERERYRHGQYDPQRLDQIAWREVAAEYDGIAVLPSAMRGQRDGDLFLPWLDTDWSVPSTCLWRVRNTTLHLKGQYHFNARSP